jgi:hypothetical protein
VTLSVIWTMVAAIFFFVAGAFIPATIIVLIGYVRQWRGQENRSLVRLIWGILLRIGGAYLVLIFVGVIVGASIGTEIHEEGFIGAIFAISMFAGLFGSIALGVFAYRRGRGKRLQMSN